MADAAMARVVEQNLGAEDVGEDELGRAHDRAVDVRLGGEIDDRVGAVGRARDSVGVGDVALEEVVFDALEVGAIAGIRQLVEHCDMLALRGEALDELRADEARAARDENTHGAKRSRAPPGVGSSVS